MNFRMKRDQWIGLFFILLGLFFLYMISIIKPVMALDPNDAGPQFFPTISTVGLIICGVGLLVMPDKNEKRFMSAQQWLKVGKYFGLMVLYLLIMHFLGFIIATAAGIFLLINMLAIGKKPKLLVVSIYSIVFSLLMYFIFSKLLFIILPSGILFG